MQYYHLQGYAQVLQTAIVMIAALLSMVTYGYRAYSTRGWWVRLLSMVAVFVILGSIDLWLNEGAGSRASDSDQFGSELGTALHYVLLILVLLVAVGTFIATFRATIKNSKGKSGIPSIN